MASGPEFGSGVAGAGIFVVVIAFGIICVFVLFLLLRSL